MKQTRISEFLPGLALVAALAASLSTAAAREPLTGIKDLVRLEAKVSEVSKKCCLPRWHCFPTAPDRPVPE